MSAAKHTLEPMPLAGWIGGFDFDHKPHGTLEVVVDEPFRTALGKNARVLLVPDELVYRAAPMLADALEAALKVGHDIDCDSFPTQSECAEANGPVGGGKPCNCWVTQAEAALRAAGRLP